MKPQHALLHVTTCNPTCSGTRSSYVAYSCRCQRCSAANAKYHRARKSAGNSTRSTQDFPSRVPYSKYRNTVNILLSNYSVKTISAFSTISYSTILSLKHNHTKYLNYSTFTKLLSTYQNLPGPSKTHSTIEHLVASSSVSASSMVDSLRSVGYSASKVAAFIGVSRLRFRHGKVKKSTYFSLYYLYYHLGGSLDVNGIAKTAPLPAKLLASTPAATKFSSLL